jgi:hypothetical protein
VGRSRWTNERTFGEGRRRAEAKAEEGGKGKFRVRSRLGQIKWTGRHAPLWMDRHWHSRPHHLHCVQSPARYLHSLDGRQVTGGRLGRTGKALGCATPRFSTLRSFPYLLLTGTFL